MVLSAAPDTADLSPALLDLTDCVFQRSARSAGGSNSVRNASAVNVETTPDVRKSAATVGAAPGVFSKGRKAGASISRAVSAKRCSGVRERIECRVQTREDVYLTQLFAELVRKLLRSCSSQQ